MDTKFNDLKISDDLLGNKSWKAGVCLDIAKGLRYLHSNNIIHRDIKSANILICQDSKSGLSVAKLGDLGLAIAVDLISRSQAGSALTRNVTSAVHYAAGTDNYKAPELLSKKRGEEYKYTNNSDLYAFGTLINEIMTGKAPWYGESPIDMIKYVVMDSARPDAWIPDDSEVDPRDSILLKLVGSADSNDDCLWHQVPFRRLTAEHCCELLQPYRDGNNESTRSIFLQMSSKLPAIPSNIAPLVKDPNTIRTTIVNTNPTLSGGGGGSTNISTSPNKTDFGQLISVEY